MRERVQWRGVVGVLGEASERSGVVDALTASGFSADSFGGGGARRPQERRPREVVCEALIRLECWRREAIRTVRRRLEQELWP